MITLMQGDCLDRLKELEDNSIDSIVTDPPYGLSFMGKAWDKSVPSREVWEECLRVLKPGGHLLAFAGTRTQHRMAVNIEDAGFEIRDMIAWVYGSGFPKSRNIGKDIEKINVGGIKNLKQIGTKAGIKVETGTSGFSYSKEYVAGKSMGGKQISGQIPVYEINNEWDGWGTALKPALEPITVARKPLEEKSVAANVLKYGTGGINIDESRVEYTPENPPIPQLAQGKTQVNSKKTMFDGQSMNKSDTKAVIGGSLDGRFPANFIHDGSDEVAALFPKTGSGNNKGAYSYAGNEYGNKDTSMFNGDKPQAPSNYNDNGSAARFFYCAKTSKSDRNEGVENNNHPTVKPTALMKYLVKLVTPPNGIVLDPFMGSGSTGKAAVLENFKFVGIELDTDYMDIAKARIEAAKEDVENAKGITQFL